MRYLGERFPFEVGTRKPSSFFRVVFFYVLCFCFSFYLLCACGLSCTCFCWKNIGHGSLKSPLLFLMKFKVFRPGVFIYLLIIIIIILV